MRSKILGKEFFEKDTIQAARSLLGDVLVHDSPQGRTSGIIVETEAYLSQGDPACHAAKGKTKRNAVMFGPPGRAYVYLIYGSYYCFNAVTNQEDVGEAVLIRALEPLEGLDLMEKRRGLGQKITNLTSGPGKLCDAMGISKEQNGLSLQKYPLFITEGVEIESSSIGVSGRIGINQAQDKPWRFFIIGNIFLSRRGV
ncbi:MAG: DNA-3-methyladenine glycosylase [Bacillota bacterium]|nr:DNA-3-methyladenine glycosylase [Bacillota bacterium]